MKCFARILVRQILCAGAILGLITTGPLMAQDAVPRPVQLMTLGADGGDITRQFFGQVVARQTVDLAFQVSGQIITLPANEGAVIRGQGLIAQLDLEPFELQLQQAQLQFDQAERALDRLNQLTSSVSEVAREDAETQLGLARVAVRNAEYALENAILLAPFDALVAARNVANFTTIAQGTPVVRLHDVSELRIEIDVPEVLFQRVGEDADLTILARFPTGDATYPLAIREFNAEASSIGQTYRITLGLPPQNGLNVLPGSSVTVIATLHNAEAAMIVPSTAVRIANDGATSVMRFIPQDDETGVLEEILVDIEPTRDGAFRVTSGITPGDTIVRTGAHAVQDGLTVRRFTGYAN